MHYLHLERIITKSIQEIKPILEGTTHHQHITSQTARPNAHNMFALQVTHQALGK